MRDGGGSMDVDEPKIHPSTTAGLDSHVNFSLLAFTGTKVKFYFPETYTNFSERQKARISQQQRNEFFPYDSNGTLQAKREFYFDFLPLPWGLD